MLNFREVFIQSCNTWFYQVGIKTGFKPIIEWLNRLGLGMRMGILLKAEEKGNILMDDYMLRVHKRKIKPGDVVNMSIGQGDILIIVQAMGILAVGYWQQGFPWPVIWRGVIRMLFWPIFIFVTLPGLIFRLWM